MLANTHTQIDLHITTFILGSEHIEKKYIDVFFYFNSPLKRTTTKRGKKKVEEVEDESDGSDTEFNE
jgi:hypothetical protein